jgi:two-component sensor histidine kinase/CheY-like chemotaxis protein
MAKIEPLIEKVNILLVDDQPGKLMSYELILQDLGQRLLKASSAKAALELLLKNDVAVILVDVCMPDLDGFELARMVRDHPRFKDTAIIFISAINVTELDSLRGYELGGVDYVPVPVVPGVLRAKVRVFLDLHIKTRALARMNEELELRVAERTEQLEVAIARQELLAREVDHRARNALAVIQSIVTLTPSEDGQYFAEAIKGRIGAMATAHNLLSESRWQGADLLRLVEEELAPYHHEERIEICGDPVSIAPAVAQNLALVLHELATNAAKYGALREDKGRLVVRWRLSDSDLLLEWVEQGMIGITQPTRRGFGTKVIEASVCGQLRGSVERSWTDAGLVCSILLPVEHFAKSSSSGERVADLPAPAASLASLSRCRVLIVEDEPLIAMMISGIVEDFGAEVMGPFGTIKEGRAALSKNFDVALLDINVGGELVFALADEIVERGVPVVFVTGYHSGALDPRFRDARILTKPVDRSELAAALRSVVAPLPIEARA